MTTLSDEDINKLLEAGKKGKDDTKDTRDKPAKGIRDSLTLDPKVYELYDYAKKEMGYDGDFSSFITDFVLGNARKMGLDIQIVKSAAKGNFIQGIPNGDGVSDDDGYDEALRLLGVTTGNPKQMAFQTLMEQKKLELEERKMRMEQMQMELESKRLDIEKKRIENEKFRNELLKPQQQEAQNAAQQTQQVNYQLELFKMMNDNNMKFMEMLAKAKSEGAGNDDFIKFLLEQNQKTNNLIIGLQQDMNEKKLQELESIIYANNSDQQLDKLRKQFELFKDLGMIGGGQKTPEEINKEYELKLKQLELEQKARQDQLDNERAQHLTEAIRDAIGHFTETIGKPMGEALAQQARDRLAKVQQNKKEENIVQQYTPTPQVEQPVTQQPVTQPNPEPSPQSSNIPPVQSTTPETTENTDTATTES